MGNNKSDHLSDNASPKEISDWLDNHVSEYVVEPPPKKVDASERARVRRSIEEIKERNSLKAFLGDDYDELLDS